jgi:exosortase A-associated hydrolase 1
MSYRERAFVFDCDGDYLVGIVAIPEAVSLETGVLVVVGGPQYRVGSHRQFVLLSRTLATQGIPCMRFDYRGMGDASGAPRDFSSIDADIRSAIDAYRDQVPGLRRIVLWGLCDAASAICFYAPRDARVAGLALLNPWVRTEATVAKVYVQQYYARRLFAPAFWEKLLSGEVAIGRSVRHLLATLRLGFSAGAKASATQADLASRMATGLQQARLPLLLVLSGRDFVANEFDQAVKGHQAWSHLLAGATTRRLDAADHTFSSAEWRDVVANETAEWVASLDHEPGRNGH